MQTFDIPVNININAESEMQAETLIIELLKPLLEKAALERAVNNWEFIEFVTEEEG
jgi:hypothetical protein